MAVTQELLPRDTTVVTAGDGAAIAAVLVAIVAVVVSAATLRNQRLSFLADMRGRWEELADDWALVLLYYSGDSNHYYSDASMQSRKEMRRLRRRIDSRRTGINAEVNEMRARSRHVRRVARFFSYVSGAIVGGTISTRDAYGLFGPDVARHFEAMHWVSGRLKVRPDWAINERTDEVPNWIALVDQMHESHYMTDQTKIVALADLLASEATRVGDFYPHRSLARAAELDGLTGEALLAEIDSLIHPLAIRRRNQIRKQLSHLFLVPSAAILRHPDPVLSPDALRYVRLPYWRRDRARAALTHSR